MNIIVATLWMWCVYHKICDDGSVYLLLCENVLCGVYVAAQYIYYYDGGDAGCDWLVRWISGVCVCVFFEGGGVEGERPRRRGKEETLGTQSWSKVQRGSLFTVQDTIIGAVKWRSCRVCGTKTSTSVKQAALASQLENRFECKESNDCQFESFEATNNMK
eukprot:g56569.t1